MLVQLTKFWSWGGAKGSVIHFTKILKAGRIHFLVRILRPGIHFSLKIFRSIRMKNTFSRRVGAFPPLPTAASYNSTACHAR
jgi:hypothetical protein